MTAARRSSLLEKGSDRPTAARRQLHRPLGNIRRTSNPLLRSMLADGLVSPDPLDLGLAADTDDRVGERLWALGPLTKGMYWEMTAVPDIRTQAERIAVHISKELAPHG
jgi:uncharacterized NAD(P)/FAD-binding protein YdhS